MSNKLGGLLCLFSRMVSFLSMERICGTPAVLSSKEFKEFQRSTENVKESQERATFFLRMWNLQDFWCYFLKRIKESSGS